MIDAPDFLPLGSVVTLLGNEEKRLMIIGRAMAVDSSDGTREYYDYALVLYPEGILGDAIVYSNHDCITNVIARGFADDEDEALVQTLGSVLAKVDDIPRAHPEQKDAW